MKISELVSWCFEPSQPLGIYLGWGEGQNTAKDFMEESGSYTTCQITCCTMSTANVAWVVRACCRAIIMTIASICGEHFFWGEGWGGWDFGMHYTRVINMDCCNINKKVVQKSKACQFYCFRKKNHLWCKITQRQKKKKEKNNLSNQQQNVLVLDYNYFPSL